MAWKGSEERELEERSKVAGVGARVGTSASSRKGFYREKKRRRASTSPGDTGSQAAACPHARRRRCAGGGRDGQGAEVHIGHCSHPYPPLIFLSVLQNFDQKVNCSKKFTKIKVCRNLQATKHILVPKAQSEWKNLNLVKQFEFQISNWGNFNF